MLRLIFIILCFVTVNGVSGQLHENIRVVFVPEETQNLNKPVYRIKIVNESDSILCILHSMYFDLGENFDQRRSLAAFKRENDSEYYSLTNAQEDTTVDAQYYPFSAELLMPHQKMEFRISLGANSLKKYFVLNYITLFDVCYRDFLKKMTGHWTLKYVISQKKYSME